MLFNTFLNDFFFCIRKASLHTFADDNTLSSFAKSVTLLVEILMIESQNAIKWFSENKPKQFLIGNDIVEVASSVKLLGIHIDDQLSFSLHNICKSTSKQLNALVRLKCFLGFEERKVLINSFILSDFNYCFLVWSISSAKSLNKVENLQKGAFRFLHNAYSSSYEELLKKSRKSTVNVSNYCSLWIEILKTLNDINPSPIKGIFKLRMTNHPT